MSPIPTPHRILAKLLKWAFVSFLVGMLPVILKALFIFADNKEITRAEVLGSGELFLVAAGLTASGVGDLLFELRSPGSMVTTNLPTQIFRAVAVIISISIVLIGAAVYGSAQGEPTVTSNYMDLSLAVLAGAAISSVSCVIIAEIG